MKDLAEVRFGKLWLLALATAIVAIGCGGGGNGGGGGNPPVAPTITTQPQNQTVTDGQTATFSVAASGTAPLSYQWKRGTTNVGSNSSSYTTPAVTMADTGVTFTVTVSNTAGNVTSNAATLTVNAAAPTITTQPQNLSVIVTQTATFSVVASGTAPLHYQWKKGTTNVGNDSNSYTTPATVLGDSGSNFTVTVSNTTGNVTSNPATLTVNPMPAADVTITVDPATSTPISPWIYGTNFYSGNTSPQPNLTFDRDGGNRWTAYNWETNASNAGSDYIYSNDNYLSSSNVPAEAVRSFIAGDQAAGLASLVTFQLQGYVSADENGAVPRPFPNLTRFKQVIEKKSTKDSNPFTTTPPTSDAYVYMDEFAYALDQKFTGMNIFGASPTHPTFISLDNEPDLWYSTHEEVQGSTNISSANFIAKTVTLTEALKDQFPNVVIFGPVNYGFNGIYSWQGDPTLSPTWSGSDWFADKYLAGIKAASTAYGKPVVDVYDFHWYSEAKDTACSTRVTDMTGTNLTDAQVQAVVQSPRSLWDPSFIEYSWITGRCSGGPTGGQPIQILTHLQNKIDASNPGMKIAITEYENGGFNHIAGTIAQADNLGIFGAQGVFAANFWPPNPPIAYSYTLAGFRAFRGFDGANANFGDTSLLATSDHVDSVMVYASSDSSTPGRYVFVAINRSTAPKVTAINGLPTLSGTAYLWQMTAASAAGQDPVQPVSIGTMPVSGTSLAIVLPALSVTTIDVTQP